MMNAEEILLLQQLTDSVLPHFVNMNYFTARYNRWEPKIKLLFLRLASYIHALGLDCWFVIGGYPIRFGRKELDQNNGRVAIRLDPCIKNFALELSSAWRGLVSDELLNKRIAFNDGLMTEIQKNIDGIRIRPIGNRNAYWPHNYDNQDQGQGDPQPNGVARSVNPRNIIYYGPPGTGKTYALKKMLENEDYKDFTFVTFHQSFGYEEFIEGLHPFLDKKSNQVYYDIQEGAFLKLCNKANKDINKENRYAIVIDEINRGNISKIFGELITLIEIDKREGKDQAISATLAYSRKPFSVPPNVDIYGTMNTADRSLALVDTALRRRFEFIPKMPDASQLKDIKIESDNVEIDVGLLLEKMNLRIEALYDRDHTIGHAYFIGLRGLVPEDQFEELTNIFRNRILPLLEEYFFDDWEKIRLVLGDNQKPDNLQFITVTNNNKYVAELFGNNNHDLDPNSIRKRYQINKKAFDQPQAYKLIYSQAV